MKNNKHTFALFLSDLSKFKTSKNFKISDSQIYSRIVKVLRMRLSDQVIFFNDNFNALVEIIKIEKKDISFLIKTFNKNIFRNKKVHAFVGLTKRPAFEEIVYFSSQIGLTSLTPVLSSKSYKSWWSSSCLSKFINVSVAAREQSKNFNPLVLHEPVNFFDLKFSQSDLKIYFDLSDIKIFDKKENVKKANNIILFVGSEGGFNDDEINFLNENKFEKIGLTKTILRTQEALLLGAGSLICILD